MRHAKAETDDDRPDHDRRLADRGREQAAEMGRWMAAHGGPVDLVWCSSALRARQTWDEVATALPDVREPEFLRAIYLAGAKDLLALLTKVPEGVESLLVIGHNPTAQKVVAELCAEPARSFPTGSVAVLEVEGTWAARGPGRLTEFVSPGGGRKGS
ncbi:MAG: phosphohistidine phosphatase [Actinomycetota bacterium]|jgi:phosphohistidine phosphatase|nr:phosphohistidine phosphatase [Actinomycetota bacterium]MDQ1640784.1 phosphohistidine phosphatase [Actinomycetota bacterium]